MKPKTVKELNEIYRESQNVDRDLYAEQRTNIQLVSGDHYNKQGSRYWNRLRESKQISPEQKLRLTKNHIQKIAKVYRNAILSYSPGVKILPKNESEIQDQKAAELNQAVWQDIKVRHKIEKKTRLWAKDFVEIGEVICKVFWDPNAGEQIGWEPEVDEEGNPILDEMGQLIQSDRAVMGGDLVFEVIHGFDLKRESSAKTLDESEYLIIDKMVSTKEWKKKYEHDDEKSKYIKESSDDTFRVFEKNSYSYSSSKDMTKVMEYYFKPCMEYPKGYFYIATEDGILEQGELPFGVWPIVYENFDEITTSPRGYSIIRQLRPWQIEINRAASKIAEHQVTLGDTKVFLYSGSKPSSGAHKPGIRYETISGQAPMIVPGQAGEQYFQYLNDQISEMYRVADIPEELEEKDANADPYALLLRSLKQKKKYSIYTSKFESFMRDVCMVSLRLMKMYAPDNLVVQAVGKNEQINIVEFKSTDDLSTQIVVDSVGDDVETSFGKQLTINNIIQYVGKTLDKKDIGKMIRLSPYLNKEKMFEDLTVDYDNAVNDVLAMDRGEYPETMKYSDMEYSLSRISARTKQADFKFKPPQIKQLYQMKIQELEQKIAEKAAEIRAMQQEFIPSGGYAVTCDLYVNSDPNDPTKTKRLRVPSESLQWLVKNLGKQGSAQEVLEQMPQGVQADIAGMLMGNSQPMVGGMNGPNG